MNKKQLPTRRKWYVIALTGIMVLTASLFISPHVGRASANSHQIISQLSATPTNTPTSTANNSPIIGGFSADTPDQIVNASNDGIKDIFYYGNPPTANSTLGLKLQALNMKVVDGFISSELYYYECQRSRAMSPRPSGLKAYCGNGSYPTFTNQKAFLATITAHLKQAQNNNLIIGYWVLDDWASWDPGGARQLLIQVHNLIQQYTPDRPAICGFGGYLAGNKTLGWSDQVAENFSPQGCDEVGLYIYAGSIPATSHLPSSNAYDWSMSAMLPAMFASLQKRGWDIAKEPLVGIIQAFGGSIAHTNSYRVAPMAKDIETQSSSFCEHGATGIVFYAWSDSGFGPATQTPLNSSEIQNGISNGIAACTQYWNNHANPDH